MTNPSNEVARTAKAFLIAGAALFALILLVAGIMKVHSRIVDTRLRQIESDRKIEAATALAESRAQTRPPTATKSKAIDVSGFLANEGYSIAVRNNESIDWPSATIHVNGILFGYSVRIGAIKAGSTVTVPLRQFTKSNGERFDPFHRKPAELIVAVPDRDSPVMTFR